MPYTTSYPIREIWVSRRREETTIVLGWRGRRPTKTNNASSLLLLLSLSPSLFCTLSLLSVIDKEGKRQGQSHDDHRVDKAIIILVRAIMRRISTWHSVIIVIIVQSIVVVEIVLDKVVDPLAERPVLLRFYSNQISQLSARYQLSRIAIVSYQARLGWN